MKQRTPKAMTDQFELQYMQLAVQEARRSRHEDELVHPYVGVVVVRDGQTLASACRGDQEPGDHAEYGALEKKLEKELLAGSTVYTTLEPCTTRTHPKVPCARRLIERRVERVVIGMLDPDQRITGKGLLMLRKAGIAVDLFPPKLMAQLEELNRDFTRDREALASGLSVPGVVEAGLTAFYPSRDYYSKFRSEAQTIDRYVSSATTTTVLVSINLMTGVPFHDLCVALEQKLRAKARFSATISLLDPERPELMAAISPVLSLNPKELSDFISRSFRELLELRSRLPREKRSRFQLRAHGAIPFGSAIILDHRQPNGRIQIETKPYKAGLQRSLAFEVMRREAGGLYDVLAASYENLVEEARVINDGDI
ncbi:MAG TPA: deaminase [Pyrinomonadaceae bacterium]|nr:deaminase [Pyrinomonadaceae bacterium]